MLFFSPVVAGGVAASAGVSFVWGPLTTAVYGLCGAVQGALGAYALTLFGYSGYSLIAAASVGAMAGAAIAAPIALAFSIKSIFEANDKPGFGKSIASFSLNVGLMFLASLLISTTLFLGMAPAISIAAGAAVTGVAAEAVRFAMS